MSITDSIAVALFCMAGVFVVLVGLSFVIKLFSYVLGAISNKISASGHRSPSGH